jgi:eukaryotic-like serine/threonine-protein kinase
MCMKCELGLALEVADDDEAVGLLAELGGYELIAEVGRGGMGVVWKARQPGLERIVAIKVLPGGDWAGAAAKSRFRREAETAARLRHPGLVAVHDCGEHVGTLWYSMDYIEGEALDVKLSGGKPMPAREAAALMEKVARAVGYAHGQGVVHRDIKPANILIDGDGEPHVTDFGLAQSGVSGSLTLSGQLTGSPHYLCPERAGSGTEVAAKEAGDVYALGATLYHALTGLAPFQGAGDVAAILAKVVAEPPADPLKLMPQLPPDLVNICLMCLEKSPSARYPSALALAEDLRRFLHGEPVQARPISFFEKVWRLSKRHPMEAGLVLALALSLLVGTVAVMRRSAEVQSMARVAQQQAYASDVFAAYTAYHQHDLGLAKQLLQSASQETLGFEWRWLQGAMQRQPLREFHGHPWIVTNAVYSADGAQLLSCSWEVRGEPAGKDALILWDARSGERLASSAPSDIYFAQDIGWLPDGRIFASGRQHAMIYPAGDLSRPLWSDPARGGACLAKKAPFMAICRWEEGWELWEVPAGEMPQKRASFAGDNSRLAITDDASLVAAKLRKTLSLWDVQAGRIVRTFDHPGLAHGAVFSADKRWLVAFGAFAPHAWDLQAPAGSPPFVLTGHHLGVWSGSFSPEGRTFVTAGSDRTVRTWEVGTWKQTELLRGHDDEVWCAAISPDGKELATAGKESTLRFWPRVTAPALAPLQHGTKEPFTWDSTGRYLCVMMPGEEVKFHDAETHALVKHIAPSKDGPAWLGLTPQGQELHRLILGAEPSLEFMHWETLASRRVALQGAELPQHPFAMAWSADGASFAVVLEPDVILVWDARTGALRRRAQRPPDPSEEPCLAMSPDGHWVATSSVDGCLITLLDVVSGQSHSLLGHKDRVEDLAFSPDGKLLASANRDATLRLWDLATLSQKSVLRGHPQDVHALTFSPDGRTLASVGFHEAVRLWHMETQRGVGMIPLPKALRWLRFSPDGRHLAVQTSPTGVEILSAK